MIDDLIDRYVKLRDKKAVMKAEYDVSVAKIDEMMTKVENFILGHLNETGTDSVGSAAGTAFKSTVTSATVNDWDSLLTYIQSNGAWNLLDHRVNKTAVAEMREAVNDIPPGVAWREETVVRIRRAST